MKWQKRSLLALMPKRVSTSLPLSQSACTNSGLALGANCLNVSTVRRTAGAGPDG